MTCWQKVDGNGGGRYLHQEFGIPDTAPAWEIHVPRVIQAEEFVFDEACLYFRDNDASLFAVSLETGAELWKIPTSNYACIYLEGNDQFLLVASTLVSKREQRILYDFRGGEISFPRRSSEALVTDGVIKEINRAERPGSYLFYNAQEGVTGVVEIGLQNAVAYDHGRHLIGLADGRIGSYDWERKAMAWTAEPFEGHPLTDVNWISAITRHHIFICVPNENFVAVLDKASGKRVAVLDLNGVDDHLDQFHIYYRIFAEDTFHFLTERRFLSFDSTTGACLWKKELDLPKRFCGAGDLLFGIVNYRELVGWDRYTGEELWHVRLEDVPSSLKVSGRYLVVSSNGGAVTCYAWCTPYRSAYRPMK